MNGQANNNNNLWVGDQYTEFLQYIIRHSQFYKRQQKIVRHAYKQESVIHTWNNGRDTDNGHVRQKLQSSHYKYVQRTKENQPKRREIQCLSK